jgi:murein endopeptidase
MVAIAVSSGHAGEQAGVEASRSRLVAYAPKQQEKGQDLPMVAGKPSVAGRYSRECNTGAPAGE